MALAGTLEPAADVTKTHTSALDTFRSLNAGRLGRIESGRVVLERAPDPRRPVLRVERAAEPIPIVTATVAMDAAILDAAATLRPAAIVVAATGAGNTSPELLAAAERAMAAGIPVVLASRSPSGCRRARATPSRAVARPGSGRAPCRPGRSPPRRRGSPLALGLGGGLRGPELAAFIAGPTGDPGDGP